MSRIDGRGQGALMESPLPGQRPDLDPSRPETLLPARSSAWQTLVDRVPGILLLLNVSAHWSELSDERLTLDWTEAYRLARDGTIAPVPAVTTPQREVWITPEHALRFDKLHPLDLVTRRRAVSFAQLTFAPHATVGDPAVRRLLAELAEECQALGASDA